MRLARVCCGAGVGFLDTLADLLELMNKDKIIINNYGIVSMFNLQFYRVLYGISMIQSL